MRQNGTSNMALSLGDTSEVELLDKFQNDNIQIEPESLLINPRNCEELDYSLKFDPTIKNNLPKLKIDQHEWFAPLNKTQISELRILNKLDFNSTKSKRADKHSSMNRITSITGSKNMITLNDKSNSLEDLKSLINEVTDLIHDRSRQRNLLLKVQILTNV
jgi:hypothetical protein